MSRDGKLKTNTRLGTTNYLSLVWQDASAQSGRKINLFSSEHRLVCATEFLGKDMSRVGHVIDCGMDRILGFN